MKYCSVVSCLSKRSDKSIKFFNFPKDLDICEQWVNFCHSPEVTERLSSSGPYGLCKFAICVEHFDPSIVAEVSQKNQLPANAVPDRIGKTHMTRTMLLEKGFDLEKHIFPQEHNEEPQSGETHLMVVEMLSEGEMDDETDETGAEESKFEFVRIKTENQLFEYEDGFKKEFFETEEDGDHETEERQIPDVGESSSSSLMKSCFCKNFKSRYEYEVNKNKHLEEVIERNREKILIAKANVRKMHERIALRKLRRIELRKQLVELKNRLKKAPITLEVETKAVESDEDDDVDFDETTAWW